MKQEEFEHYRQQDFDDFYGSNPKTKISSSALSDQTDRTLVYGYTLNRDTFHVYMENGVIHRVIYNFHKGVIDYAVEPNLTAGDCYPDKRSYPESCDREFSYWMAENGRPLCFTTFDVSRSDKVDDKPFRGERFSDLYDLRDKNQKIATFFQDVKFVHATDMRNWLDERHIFYGYGNRSYYDSGLSKINDGLKEVVTTHIYKCLVDEIYDIIHPKDDLVLRWADSVESSMNKLLEEQSERSFLLTNDERSHLANRIFKIHQALHNLVMADQALHINLSKEIGLSQTQTCCLEGSFNGLTDILEKNPQSLYDVDAKQRSLLYYAVFGSDVQIIDFLLDKDLSFNTVDALKATPLHYVCDNGTADMVNRLVDKMNNLDQQDIFGWTALMRAVKKQNIPSILVLLENGSDLYLKNNKGNDVFQIAEKTKKRDDNSILELLNSAKDNRALKNIISNDPFDNQENTIPVF